MKSNLSIIVNAQDQKVHLLQYVATHVLFVYFNMHHLRDGNDKSLHVIVVNCAP
jgi:hypothetical protein